MKVMKGAPGELFNQNVAFLPHLVGTQRIEPGICFILIPALSLSKAAHSPWLLFCLLGNNCVWETHRERWISPRNNTKNYLLREEHRAHLS